VEIVSAAAERRIGLSPVIRKQTGIGTSGGERRQRRTGSRARARERERERERREDAEMQLPMNEWIKSGRYPGSPACRSCYMPAASNETPSPPRLSSPSFPSSVLRALLSAGCVPPVVVPPRQHEISSAELAGRRPPAAADSLEPNYRLALFSCLASVRC